MTVAVPSFTVPRLQTSVMPSAESDDTGVTPVFLHDDGMLANLPFVAVTVSVTLLTSAFNGGVLASFVLMCHSAFTTAPSSTLVGAGLPTQFALISCVVGIA